MNKLAILLGLLLVSSCVFAQVEDDEILTQTPEVVEHEADDHEHLEGDLNGEQLNDEELFKDESFKERIRNLYVSCIVTSRHKLNAYGEELLSLLKGIEDKQTQQALYKKMLAEYIYACALHGTQNPNVPEEIIKSLQDKSFKVEDWDVIFMTIDFNKYKDPGYPVALSDDESNILKFVDQFDDAMKQNNGGKTGNEGGEDEEDSIPNLFGKQNYEPKIGSFSLNSISKSGQLFYFIAIIAIFGAIIIYGYKKIDDESAGPKIKNKKDKKKSQ